MGSSLLKVTFPFFIDLIICTPPPHHGKKYAILSLSHSLDTDNGAAFAKTTERSRWEVAACSLCTYFYHHLTPICRPSLVIMGHSPCTQGQLSNHEISPGALSERTVILLPSPPTPGYYGNTVFRTDTS